MRIAWNKGLSKIKSKLCECGCGQLLAVHKYTKKNGGFSYQVFKFIKGHAERGADGFNSEIHNSRMCACGCSNLTNKNGGRYYKFIKGHENIGRKPWNKGGAFTIESRRKMSISRLGKEPWNKVHVDPKQLYNFYTIKGMTASQISNMLDISKDVVKNNIRLLEISRTTKESCSTEEFKSRMRNIRIKYLSSNKAVENPNKLERLVYDTIDRLGVKYEKQKPLFNKFVVDAFFSQKNLVLEIFGKYWHQLPINVKKDYSKKKYLEKCGFKVEEIWDEDIKRKGAESVVREILINYGIINNNG